MLGTVPASENMAQQRIHVNLVTNLPQRVRNSRKSFISQELYAIELLSTALLFVTVMYVKL